MLVYDQDLLHKQEKFAIALLAGELVKALFSNYLAKRSFVRA